jgi:hypothetical protein
MALTAVSSPTVPLMMMKGRSSCCSRTSASAAGALKRGNE